MLSARASSLMHAAGFWRKPKVATKKPSPLKTAEGFSAFGTTLTVAGASSANLKVGCLGAAITGVTIGSSLECGTAAAIQCAADIQAAFVYYTGLVPAGEIYLGAAPVATAPAFAGDIAGLRFTPNTGSKLAVFFAGAAITNSINVTFDALGDPEVEFVMIVGAAAAPAAASTCTFLNGASPARLTWAITGAPSIGALAAMAGTIISPAAIGMGAGATLQGRALAFGAGVITMSANAITTAV